MRVNQSRVVKNLQFKDTARSKMIAGIDKLADAVGSTLGASGRTVVIEDDYGSPSVTKDGVTVASSITLHDPVENLGVSMMKQAAQQTASKAGDGTTTSTVLAQAIIKSYYDANGDDYSFRDIKSGIDKFAELIINKLDKKSLKIDEKRLEQVSVISSNGDVTLGKLIAEAFKQVGEDGVVTVEQSNTAETFVDFVEGTKIHNSVAAEHFFTNIAKEICELENPLVFLSATEIPNIRKIEDILKTAMQNDRAILLVAPCDGQVISALAMNKVRGNIKVSVVNPPSYGQKRKDLLEDLALLLGAKVFDDRLGDSIDAITTEMLGSADKAISDIDGTVLVIEEKPKEAVERIEELKKILEENEHPVLEKHLQERLALLNGGVSVIKIGADTEVELKEKLDRVDDAVSAVKSAQKEGILPGGGSALAFAADMDWELELTGTELIGVDIIRRAIQAPIRKILSNAGLSLEDYKGKLKGWGSGIDVIDGEVKDMVKAGIIDPTLVTKSALANAISVAVTILSTDAVISNMREE